MRILILGAMLIASTFAVAATGAQAATECQAEIVKGRISHWTYRLIDGSRMLVPKARPNCRSPSFIGRIARRLTRAKRPRPKIADGS